ncbi:beta-1,3-glucanase family protein [Cellulophaga sp. L1A9]|uniref:beta-1,3-glucanase family protein n=1 Tax=Cellulophaga sp. L1A9 TaxID=2686362 RepID=UPI00131AC64E|nr:beta-1,3-glucanase family protein [Cellulophaga sp. L1A9]
MVKIRLCCLLSFVSYQLIAQLTIPYTFENNSGYRDDEIYIGLVGKIESTGDVWMELTNSTIQEMDPSYNTISGPEWSTPSDWLYPDIFTKLSDVADKTIQIPQGLYACRIFISFQSPMYLRFHETGGYAGANLNSDTDPNDGIRWELVELTWGDSGLWTNTSRVDAYQYPMALEVNGFSGGLTGANYSESYANAINGDGTVAFKKIGELLSHEDILAKWDEEVSEAYLVAKTVKKHSYDGGPIIEQPSKVAEFPKDVLEDYIDEIWSVYSQYNLNINIGDRGTWVGTINEDGAFKFTDPADGSTATIYWKPTTVNALEGSGSLAYTPYDASIDVEAYNEDLMIQAQISAAITRHAIYTNITDDTVQYSHDDSRYFIYSPFNEYVKYFHDDEISYDSKTYAFAYDDVGDHSSTIQCTFPTDVKVIIGGYGVNSVSDSVSIDKGDDSEEALAISPNPTTGINPQVTGIGEDVVIAIYGLDGKFIGSELVSDSDSFTLETLGLADGMYLIVVREKLGKTLKSFKLLVN